jgi:two-component sensor histidine kinase
VEYRFRHKDGHYRWLVDRFTAIADAAGCPRSLVGSTRDITERKQAEEALRELNESLEQRIGQRTAQVEESNAELRKEITARQRVEQALHTSEAKYRALFSEMMNGSALHEIVCDAAGRPVDYITLEVNKTYESLLGVPGAAVVGKKASELLPPEELKQWLSIFGPVALTGQSTHYTMHSPLNQKDFEGNVYCPDKGKFAVTFIDVTERVRAEAERSQADAALRSSETRYRDLAEENARLLGQSRQDADTKAILLHEVNHRVKNNLAAIIGLLQMELRYLDAAQKSPYRLLVQDLTSRIQSLALVHNLLSASLWSPLSLEKLAQNVMQIAPVMLSRQQPIQVEISPTPVHLTPKQASAVALILNELATNSLKHALLPDQTISLSLRTEQSGDDVRLEYRDNGPGYPEEILRGTRESVGLYLIEALAEHDLEGKIAFDNDRGAVARLQFALAPAIQPHSPSEPAFWETGTP